MKGGNFSSSTGISFLKKFFSMTLFFVVRIVPNNTLFPSIYTYNIFVFTENLLHKLLQRIFALKFKIRHKCLNKYNYACIIKELTVVRMTLKELKFQCSQSHYKNTQCQLPSCTFLTQFIILFQFPALHHLQDKNTCFHSLKCKVVTVHAMKAYGGVEVLLH